MNLFKSGASSDVLHRMASKYASIETEKRKLSAVPPQNSQQVQETKDRIQKLHNDIEEALLTAIRSTTSGLTTEEKTSASKALWSRLGMALGGGVALVAPMLIMVLHPAKLTAILTTSLCVLGVAIGLAVFMIDSQPKDVLACTAGYAAVLVVFVGTGGGT